MATVRQVEAMGSQSGKPKCKVDITYCGKATKTTATKASGAKAKGSSVLRRAGIVESLPSDNLLSVPIAKAPVHTAASGALEMVRQHVLARCIFARSTLLH